MVGEGAATTGASLSGWDRNDDGLGEVAYELNDNVDRLLGSTRRFTLMNSPGIEVLRWVQRPPSSSRPAQIATR